MPLANGLPSVSLIVVAYNAAHHLPTCLDSLAALDYPKDLREVILVDNGSTDGTAELLRERFPWVRLLAQERNLGFAEANNVGVAASEADCVAFVNADMHFASDWLREMVSPLDAASSVTCVSSLILDWEGRHVDFAGGLLNFIGHGNQIGYGQAVEEVAVRDLEELLFPCGGAMLIDRKVFGDAGGFDPAYFIYFEDIDLGWRMRLLGHRTVLAARAKAYHRYHGTTSGFRAFQVKTLYERNALRTLIKNLGDDALSRILPSALMLLVYRARMFAGSDRRVFDLGAPADALDERVSRLALAHLHAVGDVVEEFEALFERRRWIQERRQVPDEQVLRLFRRPFQPSPRDDDVYLDAVAGMVRALGIEPLFRHRRATSVLAISTPGSRVDELARALKRHVSVSVTRNGDAAAAQTDIVLLDAPSAARYPELAGTPALRVVDLAGADPAGAGEIADVGEVFLCATETERAVWADALQDAQPLVVASPWGDDPPANAPTARGAHPALLRLVEDPWSYRSSSTASPPTEDVQLRRRRASAHSLGTSRSLVKATASSWGGTAMRARWRSMPEAVRIRLQPLHTLARTVSRRAPRFAVVACRCQQVTDRVARRRPRRS